MNRGITDDPSVKALLRRLADERDHDDPVGELSRALLCGETSPQELLRHGWYGEGLASAVEAGRSEFNRMSPQQRTAIEDAAVRLREAPNAGAGGNS
ncbi:hypothetical protein OHA21_00035 [Actinoplanes sp. NBC_00393]|uniref:hypothetical protein n=1 Tax=Actinoplanes sp. NBC_00393 TaxID=2975953 RepID=UPI002E1BC23B